MGEDSKELAGAGSFGASIHFHSHDTIPVDEFTDIMIDMLESVGESVTKEGFPLLGHVKAFITTPHGFLKLNLIDMELGVERTSTIKGSSVKEGELKLMAALVGVPDHKIQEIIGETIRPLAKHFELELEEDEHHEHDDH